MKTDIYNIEENWLLLKELFKEHDTMDNDLYSFILKQNKKASKRIRKKLLNIHKLSGQIRKNILAQRKENESDYEDY